MEYSLVGTLSHQDAHRRVDQILTYSLNGLGKQAIFENSSNDLIGYCGIEPFDLKGLSALELGYRIIKSKRNQGFATEAARVMVESYTGDLYAYIEKGNKASARVIEKMGFSYRGEAEVQGAQVMLFKIECRI